MVDLNLRQAIVQRVAGKSEEELSRIITDSIGGDDRTLPGLGFLFEIMWKHIGNDMRMELVRSLKANLTPAQG